MSKPSKTEKRSLWTTRQPDDLREKYAALSDETLVPIQYLVEKALRAYLKRRGVV